MFGRAQKPQPSHPKNDADGREKNTTIPQNDEAGSMDSKSIDATVGDQDKNESSPKFDRRDLTIALNRQRAQIVAEPAPRSAPNTDVKQPTAERQNPIANAIERCRRGLIGVGIFSIFMNMLMLTGPFFMLLIYDRILASQSVPTLVAIAMIAIALYCFYGAFMWVRSCLLARLSQAFDAELADLAFENTTKDRHQNKASPAQDLKQVQKFIAGPSIGTLFDVPWFPLYLFVIFMLHPVLGLLGVAGSLALVTIAIANKFSSSKKSDDVAKQSAQEDKWLRAGQSQVEELHAMGMISHVRKIWREQHDARINGQAATANRQALFGSFSKSLRLMLQSAILGVGAFLVIQGELTGGGLIAASIIFGRAMAPLDQMIAQWQSIATSRTAFTRLKSSLSEFVKFEHGVSPDIPQETLTASNMSVMSDADGPVLVEDVNFALQAGDAMGIVGHSGSGKTTLIKALLGLRPTSEETEVRLDGATLDHWPMEQRGEFIGYLPQDIRFFPGTIAQNISRFSPEAKSQDVYRAAKLAQVHDLILSKPEGYNTVVGPGGLPLSGGERQRIAMARAVYGDPFLLAFDEPDSNLDATGETMFHETIMRMRAAGCIVLVISHKGYILSQVNKLLMVEAGRQVFFGPVQDIQHKLQGSIRRERLSAP